MDPRVKLGFMDCIVQSGGGLFEGSSNLMDIGDKSHNNSKNALSNAVSEEVTFLYKLCSGSSPRSYGINVARLARLPDIVIQVAMEQSADFETRLNNKRNKNGSDNNDSNGFDEKIKRRMNAYYEKLVSIVSDDTSSDSNSSGSSSLRLDALVYNAMELWRRYTGEFNQ